MDHYDRHFRKITVSLEPCVNDDLWVTATVKLHVLGMELKIEPKY